MGKLGTPEAGRSGDGADKDVVSALARGLELLECFRTSRRFLGMQELVNQSGLPKATVSRLVHTLVAHGYLEYSESDQMYFLGSGVISLGFSALGSMGIRQVARPLMRELADQCSASIGIATRDRRAMVYVENCASIANQNFRLSIGSRVPLATSALGRAYFCGLDDVSREALLRWLLEQAPGDYKAAEKSLVAGLRMFEASGFCVSVGEWQTDVNAIGVPYRAPDGTSVLAFNCCGPAFQLPEDKLVDQWGPRLVNLVRNVDAAMRPS